MTYPCVCVFGRLVLQTNKHREQCIMVTKKKKTTTKQVKKTTTTTTNNKSVLKLKDSNRKRDTQCDG